MTHLGKKKKLKPSVSSSPLFVLPPKITGSSSIQDDYVTGIRHQRSRARHALRTFKKRAKDSWWKTQLRGKHEMDLQDQEHDWLALQVKALSVSMGVPGSENLSIPYFPSREVNAKKPGTRSWVRRRRGKR